MSAPLARADAFCRRFDLRLPVLLAPMAGASAPSLSIAVMTAGGLGACGALLMRPAEIAAWAAEVREQGAGPFQLNLWIPDPPPRRDPAHESRVRAFLAGFGPEVPPEAGDTTPPDFAAQCDALLAARPPIVSSVMGLYPPAFVARLKQAGIAWFANISTVAEARAAEAAGADAVVAQGMEAGGHRGCFEAAEAERRLVGLFALLPAVVDAVTNSRRRHGRHRRRARRCRGPGAGRERGADRNGIPALPGGQDPPCLGRCARRPRPRGHGGQPCVQRPRRPQCCDRLCAQGHRTGRAATGALPGAARPDRGDAHRRPQGRRCATHAALGRPIRRLARPEPAAHMVRAIWDEARSLLA